MTAAQLTIATNSAPLMPGHAVSTLDTREKVVVLLSQAKEACSRPLFEEISLVCVQSKHLSKKAKHSDASHALKRWEDVSRS